MTVHPRIRGERLAATLLLLRAYGSSPHTRGTPGGAAGRRPGRRFIPAYAGNAAATPRPRPARAVHPRIRGERKTGDLCRKNPDGSSPHTRGTPRGARADGRPGRFIPAYAGNAAGGRTRLKISHGSSPHTRGTRANGLHQLKHQRFIPAYAGNAGRTPPGVGRGAVHPRIRGERTSNKLLIYQGKIAPSDSTKHSAC